MQLSTKNSRLSAGLHLFYISAKGKLHQHLGAALDAVYTALYVTLFFKVRTLYPMAPLFPEKSPYVNPPNVKPREAACADRRSAIRQC